MARKLHISLTDPFLWCFLLLATLVVAWLSFPAQPEATPNAAPHTSTVKEVADRRAGPKAPVPLDIR
jgi:hypothetical protein